MVLHQDLMEKGEAGRNLDLSPSDASFRPFPQHSCSVSSQSTLHVSDTDGDKTLRSLLANLSSVWSFVRKRRASRSPDPIVCNLPSCPKGYPRVAAYLDSDENFMIYRRFGYVQARVLLEKQDELRKLEHKLKLFDEKLGKQRPAYLTTRDLRLADIGPRTALMKDIEKTFCEYANLLNAAQQLVALNRPSSSERTSVENFLGNTQQLAEEEQEWILYREDLVTLRPGREHAWLDRGIEHILKWTHCSLVEFLFCSAETRKKTSLPTTEAKLPQEKRPPLAVYYTRSRIDRLVVSIITAMILVLLVVPVDIMYKLVDRGNSRTDTVCIGVLLVFTLAFSAVLSLFTRARRHEILAAAAAYCAVLVVFLGNVGSNEIQRY